MAPISPPEKRPRSSGKHIKPPELKVTRYDRFSSFMITIVIGLVITMLASFMIWMSSWKPTPETVPEIRVMVSRAGFADENPVYDFPDLAETSEEFKTEKTFEVVLRNSGETSEHTYALYKEQIKQLGAPQRGQDTGRPLDIPGDTRIGIPRNQRWFMRFTVEDALEEYARQLDFFNIELGVLFVGSNTISVFSNLSSPNPRKKTITASTMPKGSLPFIWKGGSRKEADIKLLEKSGISNASSGIIVHLYPRETQQLLLKAEQSHRNRKTEDIRRTYFVIQKAGNGYEFKVTRQWYF